MASRTIGILLFLVHAGVVLASLAGPAVILVGTFRDDGRISPAAWRNVFGDLPRWAALLRNTAVVSGVAVAACMAAGAAFAAIVFKTDIRLRAAAAALLLLAAAIPLYVVNGSLLSVIGVQAAKDSAAVAGLIHAVAHLPIAVLIIGAALRSVSSDLEETAMVEGAGAVRTVLSVSLRMAGSGLIAALVLVTLWTTTDYSVSDVLLVRTFAEEVYTQYQLCGRPQEPALVSVPQIVLFAGLLWALRRGFLGGDPADDGALVVGARRRFRAGSWRIPLTLVAVPTALTLAVMPILSLAARVPTAQDFGRIAWGFGPEIATSLATGFAAAVLVAVLGVGLAWYAVRRPRWRGLISAYVILMLAVPAPVLGMGMILLFNRHGLPGLVYDSPLILVLAYTFRFLPVAVILLIPAVRAVPAECELSARADGCGGVGIWWHILWPLCLPTALVVLFAVMVLSVGELPCSLLVTPPGYNTVGARFFSLIHYGLYPDAATLCLVSIAAVLIPWGGLTWLLRKRLFD